MSIFNGQKIAAVIFAESRATNECAADRSSSLSFRPLNRKCNPSYC